jgi:hypothetical protein
MSGQPHLIVMGMIVEQRLADFHVEVERLRLARLAQQSADRRQAWPDLAAVVAVVLVLVLALLAADVAIGRA